MLDIKECVEKLRTIQLKEGYPISEMCKQMDITYITYKKMVDQKESISYFSLKKVRNFLKKYEEEHGK